MCLATHWPALVRLIEANGPLVGLTKPSIDSAAFAVLPKLVLLNRFGL